MKISVGGTSLSRTCVFGRRALLVPMCLLGRRDIPVPMPPPASRPGGLSYCKNASRQHARNRPSRYGCQGSPTARRHRDQEGSPTAKGIETAREGQALALRLSGLSCCIGIETRGSPTGMHRDQRSLLLLIRLSELCRSRDERVQFAVETRLLAVRRAFFDDTLACRPV